MSHTASRLAAMTRPVYAAIGRHAGKVHPRPALVFVPSRRHSRSTAVDMLTMAHADGQSKRFLHINSEEPSFVRLLENVQVIIFLISSFVQKARCLVYII